MKKFKLKLKNRFPLIKCDVVAVKKEDITLENVSKKVGEAINLVEKFKSENDTAIKEGTDKTAEHQTKIDKMLTDITTVMEAKQNIDNRLKTLECLPNFGTQTNVDEGKQKNHRKLFEEFARKGQANQSFEEYLSYKGLDDVILEMKTMSVNSDPDGGFLINPEIGAPEKTRMFETSDIRSIAKRVQVSVSIFKFPVRDGARIGATWVTEEQARPKTDTRKFSQKLITAHEMYANPAVTQEMLDDTSFNILQWVSEDTVEDFAIAENTAFVSGDGIGKPRGFLTYPAWAVNDVYEKEKIEQINSGEADTFTADGTLALQNSLKTSYQANASYIVKRAAFLKIAQLKRGDGDYLFNRNLDKNVGLPFSLNGKPLMFAEDMNTLAANSLSLAYGDWFKGYMIVDRIGIRTLRDPFTDKPLVLFYSTKRTGGDVYNWEAIKIQKTAA